MSKSTVYKTNWVDTLVILVVADIILYFTNVGHSGVALTLRVLSIFSAVGALFIYENMRFRYLKIENKELLTRNGYFAKHMVIPIVTVQGIRASQQSRIDQPNLEIDYLVSDGSHQKLVLNAYVYHDGLPQFLKDVQQLMPNIQLDDVCRRAIEKGKWPLLPVKTAP